MIIRRLAAIAVAAGLLAGVSSAAAVDTTPTTTAPTGATPPAPGVIAAGVTISGVPVGGLTVDQARAAVLAARVAPLREPLPVTANGRTAALSPVAAGLVANVQSALDAALAYGRDGAQPAVDLPLPVTLNPQRLDALIALKATALDVPAVDAAVSFRDGHPIVRKARLGMAVDIPAARRLLSQALLARSQPVYALPTRRVVPAVRSAGRSIVINRRAFRLTVYQGTRALRSFPVAVGQPAYPTPGGRFKVIQMQRNPTWNPPDSRWAKGMGPIPPGPGNPLGTRWIGTSAPGIGIHGTPADYSIGTRASHGCIRMHIRDAERLFGMVSVGIPVMIV